MAEQFEYAPAPESRAIVDAAASPTGSSSTASSSPGVDGARLHDHLPGDRGAAGRGRRGRPRRRRPRGDGRPRGLRAAWSRLPGAERAKYLFRIARIIQERSRELAVLESLDNGKPIRESRDVDLPLAAAHFFYYAGWADKLEYAGLRPGAAAARRRRPDHPLELPAADAGLEDRPGAGRRQHGGAQAGRDDAAHRAAPSPRSASRPSCRRASSTSSPATGATGAALVATPASTRSPSPARPRSARRSPARGRQRASGSPSNSAARPPTSSSTTRPIDQAVEGIVNGIFFNQGHVCCAGSRLLVQESVTTRCWTR